MEFSEAELLEATNLIPSLWVEQNGIVNESGLPLVFHNRLFLIDIYNDFSPKQAILKPPQIGMTICMTIKSFFVAKHRKKDIIYTLPTATDVNDIVGGSVNRIIVQNPILQEWVKEHDTVEQKSVGENLIRYRGTFSPKQATMVPSSLNIHDEVDNSDPGVLTLYETRLEAQESENDKWRWYFSHPSLAGHGVDVYWQQSDQKEWFITCNNCNHEQTLTWGDSIDMHQGIYVCKNCKHEIPDEVRINGRWKATATGEFSGYHVSQLMLYNKSAKDIIKAYQEKDRQYFYNYVLGLPYVSSENKIEPAVVLRNCSTLVNEQDGQIVIGVDTGLPIHYSIGNEKGIFHYGKCATPNPYDELEGFLRRWPRSILVSDQGGDLVGIRVLQDKYPGRVFLCYYRKDRKSLEMIKWGEDNEFGTVVVDRNRMIQMVVEQLRDTGRIVLNGSTEDWREFADHFGNMYREEKVVKESPGKDVSTSYGVELIWKRNGPDHFAHTLVYLLTGLDRYASSQAKIIGNDLFAGILPGRSF